MVLTSVDAAKLAVTVAGVFIVTFWGVAVPDKAPVKPENVYPPFAAALTDWTVPALSHVVAGLIAPPALGLVAVVNWYWVVKLAVYVVADAGAVIEWDCAPLSDQLA